MRLIKNKNCIVFTNYTITITNSIFCSSPSNPHKSSDHLRFKLRTACVDIRDQSAVHLQSLYTLNTCVFSSFLSSFLFSFSLVKNFSLCLKIVRILLSRWSMKIACSDLDITLLWWFVFSLFVLKNCSDLHILLLFLKYKCFFKNYYNWHSLNYLLFSLKEL